ncbi:hypothetical protein I656_01241 [Geobacillus sp. WSUCF1]|nr:hypothetical protein I656_01241 [Geobacillus sp. WSUCF1]
MFVRQMLRRASIDRRVSSPGFAFFDRQGRKMRNFVV